jgi:hypothetical protein
MQFKYLQPDIPYSAKNSAMLLDDFANNGYMLPVTGYMAISY